MRRLTLLLMLAIAGCANPALPDAPHGPIVPGQVAVTWRKTPDASERLGFSVIQAAGLRELLAVPVGQEVMAARRLAVEPDAAVAEPNYVVSAPEALDAIRHVTFAPNDQGFNNGQRASWGLKAIHADQAWDVTAGDPRIVVAVIDTGCDMQQPDLQGNLDTADAYNLVEAHQPVDDDYGHGTHVCGIVAAVGDNTIGTLGVAWKCRVMPIRVLGVDGTGTSFDTVSAIEYAIAKGAKVINMSLGSADRSEQEAEAVQAAIDAGVVVVAAAGNEATQGNYDEYPASYPGVLSVAAVGEDLQRAPFSNYNSHVAIAAPGVDILSTLPSRFASTSSPPYGYLSGTSMATPFVSGVAALVFSRHPTWSGQQVVARLEQTTDPLASPTGLTGFNEYFGYGLVDAAKAVQ